jgi:hypothetical protein
MGEVLMEKRDKAAWRTERERGAWIEELFGLVNDLIMVGARRVLCLAVLRGGWWWLVG